MFEIIEKNGCQAMKGVFHIVGGVGASGRSRVILDIIGELKDEFRFTVVSITDSVSYPDGIECVSLGKTKGFSFATVFKLARYAKERKAGVFHSHGRGALVYSVLAARLAGVRKIIHTVHRSDGDRVARLKIIRRTLLNNVSVITAVSDAAGKEFARANEYRSRIITVYNGIDINRFRTESDKNGTGPVIGMVASLSFDKDHETLLKGFAGILESYPVAHLVIVGDGPRLEYLKNIALRLNIAQNVDFTGFSADIPVFLSKFAVFVHSAYTEGFGIAILEAMAAGIPVVASNVGGIPEVVEDNVSGLLFEQGNSEALCAAILKLLKDDKLKNNLILNARDRLLRKFSLERVCNEYRRIYSEQVIVNESS